MRSVPGNATERQRIIFWFASFVNRLADWFGIAAGAEGLGRTAALTIAFVWFQRGKGYVDRA